MKRAVSALLAVFLLLSFAPANARAAEEGELNESIHWSLDDSGTLTITGTGPMPDYIFNYYRDGTSLYWSYYSDWAYMPYADQITSVVVGEGITSIGKGCFVRLESLQSVHLPETVREISAMAFYGCANLTEINAPAELEDIYELAFDGCDSLRSFTLPAAERDRPAVSDNAGASRESTVRSYLYLDGDDYVRVESINGQIVAERYDSDFNLLSARTLESDLSAVWGGFFAGETYNFIITGRQNMEERSDAEVIRIRKYGKDWTLLDERSICGQNTQIPFRAGSLRCSEQDGVLWIHTCHQMFRSDDGRNHQANMTLSLREKDLELLFVQDGVSNVRFGYASHSFNQYVLADREGNLVLFDHGDAYPRSAALRRQNGDRTDSVDIQVFPGATGDNTTGGSLGGLAETDAGYLTAYNYNGVGAASEGFVMGVRTEDPMPTRNVYLGFTSKREFSEAGTTVRKITDYADNGPLSAGNPVLVATGPNEGYLIWDVLSLSSGDYFSTGTLAYVRYGRDGSVSEIRTLEGKLSDCQPIAVDGKAVWYVTDNAEPVFYVLDDDIEVSLGPEKLVFADAGMWTDLMVDDDNYSEDDLQKLCALFPDKITVTTNYGRELQVKVSGWTLDTQARRWTAEIRPEDLPEGITDPNGLLDQVYLTYTVIVTSTRFDTIHTPVLGESGGFEIFTSGTKNMYADIYHLSEHDGVYTAERMPAQAEHQTDSSGRIIYEPTTMLYYRLSAWQKSDAGIWTCLLYKPDGTAVFCGMTSVSFPGDDPGPDDPGPEDPGPEKSMLEMKLFDVRPAGGIVYPGDEFRISFDVTNTGDTDLEISDFQWIDQSGADTDAYLTQRVLLKPGESLSEKSAEPYYVIDSVGPEDVDRDAETAEIYGLLRFTCGTFGYAPGTDKILCTASASAEFALLKEGHVHEWEDGFTVDRSPTCTRDGSKSIHCKRCTAVRDQTAIPALGHDFAGGICTRCGVSDPNDRPGSGDSFRFDDVRDAGKFYYHPVYWAYEHSPQITNGTDPTHFSPDATCTRGQVVTFLWRAAGCPEPSGTNNPFTDVKPSAFYYKAVLWAVEKNITKGVSADRFGPDQGCTRGQVVTFLHRFAGTPEPNSTENPFTDVKDGAFYYKAVLWAVEKNVTNGTGATAFSPDATCTRGQIVTFLYRTTKEQ